jgi:hypothetical protein
MRNLLTRKTAMVLVAPLAVLVGVGVGVAATQSDPVVIHACYSNKDGSLRVLSAGGSCVTKKETALDWNQAGPEGSPGVSGYERVNGNDAVLGGNASISSDAFCPAGKKLLGGGWDNNSFGSGGKPFTVIESAPNTTNPKDGSDPQDFWAVTVAVVGDGTTDPTFTFHAIAICANVAT